MMRGKIGFVLAFAMVISGLSAAVVYAGNDQPARKSAAESRIAAAADAFREIDFNARVSRCSTDVSTLRALKRTLKCLKAEIAVTQDIIGCMGLQGVSAYGEDPLGGTWGYLYTDLPEETPWFTTALDWDASDYPQALVVAWFC